MFIAQRVKALALQLQADGPDEFPYAYYEHEAEVQLGLHYNTTED